MFNKGVDDPLFLRFKSFLQAPKVASVEVETGYFFLIFFFPYAEALKKLIY